MDYYQLLANYEEIKLDVRVNDMPVELSGEKSGGGVHAINNLLTGADNTITVIAKPSRGAAHPQAGASMHINITSFAGQGSGGGRSFTTMSGSSRIRRKPCQVSGGSSGRRRRLSR